jgi:hypothetical protein
MIDMMVNATSHVFIAAAAVGGGGGGREGVYQQLTIILNMYFSCYHLCILTMITTTFAI